MLLSISFAVTMRGGWDPPCQMLGPWGPEEDRQRIAGPQGEMRLRGQLAALGRSSPTH